jgi:hypothetical protein
LSTSSRRTRSFAAWLLLVLCAIAGVGCAGAPVQEMSNARQAVRAAEKAGAVALAPELLAEARQALRNAESHLRQGEYRTARDEAELARAKAVEARRVAEATGKNSSSP